MKKKQYKKQGYPAGNNLIDFKVLGNYEFRIDFMIKIKKSTYMQMKVSEFEELKDNLQLINVGKKYDMTTVFLKKLSELLPEGVIVEKT